MFTKFNEKNLIGVKSLLKNLNEENKFIHFDSDNDIVIKNLFKIFSSEEKRHWLVYEKERYLGLIFFDIGKKYSRIHTVALIEEAKGKGLGKHLIETVEKEAIEANSLKILLEVEKGNKAVLSFYTKLDYEIIAIDNKVYKLQKKLRNNSGYVV